MAESRRQEAQGVIEAERGRGDEQNREPAGQATRQLAERTAELGRESLGRATGASVAEAARSGSAMAECAQEITAAWAHYAKEVMRHTSEASQALLRARTFSEMLEVQAKLLRDNMQAFLDQSVKIAESASRMATSPIKALKEAGAEQSRR